MIFDLTSISHLGESLFCVHENMQCEFYLEGGAMVLANGRVVYTNEFDKM